MKLSPNKAKYGLVTIVYLLSSFNSTWAISNREIENLRREMEAETTETGLVNQFVVNSGQAEASTTTQLQQLTIQAKLLTPLNSNLNYAGDPIQAEITQPVGDVAKPLLPVGTILEGYVEGQHRNGRGMRDGNIVVKFYWATIGDKRFDLFLAPNVPNGRIYPGHNFVPLTGKQKLRLVLMLASKIAIPAAIGTGGISLAITAGAGAVIGGVLADNHQYFKGAARGAWEGAGLNCLDPLILKGKEMRLPSGTPLQLTLIEPASIPSILRSPQSTRYITECLSRTGTHKPSSNKLPGTGEKLAELSASATLLGDSNLTTVPEEEVITLVEGQEGPAPADPMDKIDLFVQEKNLAAALETANRELSKHPDDEHIKARQDQILELVTGKGKN